MLSTLFHAIALHIAIVTFYFSPSLHIFLPQYPQILLYCLHFHSHYNVAKLRISLFFLLVSWDFLILLITSLCPSFPGHNKLGKSNSLSLTSCSFSQNLICASSRSQPPRPVACRNLPWWKSPARHMATAARTSVPQCKLQDPTWFLATPATKQSFWLLSPLL